MRDFVVSVPDDAAQYFIDKFGIDGIKMLGYDIVGEIVRCKDCKYYKEIDGLTRFNLAFCKFHDGPCEPDGFCAWGERKPEDD